MPLDTPVTETEAQATSHLAEAQNNPVVIKAKRQASEMLEMAKTYTIDCQEMAEAAAEDLKEIKSLHSSIEAMRKDAKAPVLAEGKAIDEFFNAPLSFLKDAEGILKRALQKFIDHVAEVQRKAEEEAQKRAEEERKRLEAEHQAKIEAAKEAGNTSAVEELQTAPPAFVPEVVAPTVQTPALAGISSANNWKARVTDMMALVKAVAEGKADIALLEANQKALNNRAKEMKEKLSIPGVEAFNDRQIRARSK